MVDLTHDTFPNNDTKWRPIQKTYDRVPPIAVLEDKTLLREWEIEQMLEYFSYIYDRKNVDFEVLRRFQAQGEIIKMAIDYKDLTRDKNFWKTEAEIADKALFYLKQLQRLKPFDYHKIQPQTYDMKLMGDPGAAKKRKGADEKTIQKKKTKLAKDN